MGREKPKHEEVAFFCKHHLNDKYLFGPFTGQDYSAWKAYVYALELYGRSDSRHLALIAMRALVASAQQKEDVMMVFVQAIPGVLDWAFVHGSGTDAGIWPEISPSPFINLQAIDRPCDWQCSSCNEVGYGVMAKAHKRCPGPRSVEL